MIRKPNSTSNNSNCTRVSSAHFTLRLMTLLPLDHLTNFIMTSKNISKRSTRRLGLDRRKRLIRNFKILSIKPTIRRIQETEMNQSLWRILRQLISSPYHRIVCLMSPEAREVWWRTVQVS